MSYEYEMREAAEFHREMSEADKGSLAERKEACREFAQAMRDPALVAERVGWLIDGNYGYGAMQAAKRAIAATRSNRQAILTHMIGAIEWKCPARMAVTAWKKLSSAEKAALAKAINAEIKGAE
jgi:hypothetical protein